jgi:putative FmdB family regulatory protein
MPTYEYTCRDCGHTFDIVQSMWDEPLTMCPECGGSLRKVFAPPAISFKGSGFYATDHGKKSKRSEGKDDGAKPKDGAEKTEKVGATDGSGKKEPSSSGTEKGSSSEKGRSSKKEPAA